MRENASRVICLVDDNADAAESLSALLQIEGYEVHAAHNGIDGLASIFRTRPFLAILDIGMPGLTGYDVASQVRATFGDSMRLVALSGWGADSDVKRAMAAGFDNYLTKSANPAELLALVQAYASDTPGDNSDFDVTVRPSDPTKVQQ